MVNDRVKSKAFHLDKSLTKDEQERHVCEAFRIGYEKIRGIPLEGNDPVSTEPPDRSFRWQGRTFGVELFELEQMYDSRALVDLITNAIYEEFGKTGQSGLYEGLTAQLVFTISITTPQIAKNEWKLRGIKKRPESKVAKEFVALFMASVASHHCVSEFPGLLLPIDPIQYPALSVLSKMLTVSRCKVDDPRRSDGKAAPLVIIGGSYIFADSDIEASIQSKMTEKIRKKPNWQSFDYSILLAHDLPRAQFYEAFGRSWWQWLTNVAHRLSVADTFDEVWLVTYQNLDPEAQLIIGRSPNDRS